MYGPTDRIYHIDAGDCCENLTKNTHSAVEKNFPYVFVCCVRVCLHQVLFRDI
jgi:hypothetical protein